MGDDVADKITGGLGLSGESAQIGQCTLLIFESTTGCLQPGRKDIQFRTK